MFDIIPGSVATFAHTSLDDDVAKLQAYAAEHRKNIKKGRLSSLPPPPHASKPSMEPHKGLQGPRQCMLPQELVLLEVAPGFCVRLRGFEETWPTVLSGTSVITRCTCCATQLGSLPDAEFVLCPECRFISLAGNKANDKGGGLGLGINMKTVGTAEKTRMPSAA
jgi:hypothetical protein